MNVSNIFKEEQKLKDTIEDCFQHFAWENRFATPNLARSTRAQVVECLRELRPYRVSGDTMIRLGPYSDGGYLVPSGPIANISQAICVGVGHPDAIGFDLELADMGKEIFQYDHIIRNYSPPAEYVGRVSYFPYGLSWQGSGCTKTLEEIVSTHCNTGKSTLAKIDIEGDEWASIFTVNDGVLDCLEIIVMEIHWIRLVEFEQLAHIMKMVLSKLNKTHAPVHLHSNNMKRPFLCQGILFPNVMEVTWVKRSNNNDFIPNPFLLRHPLDVLTDPSRVEQHFPNPWCI